jgi:hypothetical protein
MSKVEVKKGDTWDLYVNDLYQRRGDRERVVIANGKLSVLPWRGLYNTKGETMPHVAARAWIESLGGTVVEEREEAVPSTLTVKIYRSTHDGSLWMIDSPTHAAPSGYVFIGTTTIHIAGVTA